MKKYFILAASLAFLASCTSDEIVDNGGKQEQQVPITLAANRKNVTRAGDPTSLESNLHYNFGVWAQKIKSGSDAQKIMENYLVGYSNNTNTGYKVGTLTTTYATAAGSTSDHTSPWFYEGLGTAEYTYDGTEGFYKSDQAAYMSAHTNQYLRYWDLAYTNTNFYCYLPYQKTGVTTVMAAGGTATMTFTGTTIRDGYDNTPNTAYAGIDRSLSEFMVGGVQATNSALSDIIIPFKHMGAQLFIRFYEDVPGYKVEIVNLSDDSGSMKSGSSTDQGKGIQATPSVKTAGTPDTYTLGSYYTTSGATVAFSTTAVPAVTPVTTGATTKQDNLMFFAPSTTAADYSTAQVPSGFGANLTTVDITTATQYSASTHYVIPEYAGSGTQSTFAWSPTIYYPVAQPQSTATEYTKTGFNFHVTFRIIADDTKEVTTVHNAEVFVPETYTTWASNTRYIYTFKITRDASGTTNPGTTIDPADPTPHAEKSLYPIVFDGCTVENYTESNSEHNIN